MSSATARPLATIGYERATLADVVGRLKAAEVEVVVDVRAVAASRRPGFSKRILAASLAEAGVDYVHLRALGTPKAGREAARKGKVAEMQAIFEGHMAEPAAQAELVQATEIAQARRAALLCFEAEACGCHRRILAGRIRDALACDVVDL